MKERKEISIEEVIKLREEGMTIIQIANKLGCCDVTLRKRLNEKGAYITDRKEFKRYESVDTYECTELDKRRKLTREDIEFLKKYNLEEFNK